MLSFGAGHIGLGHLDMPGSQALGAFWAATRHKGPGMEFAQDDGHGVGG